MKRRKDDDEGRVAPKRTRHERDQKESQMTELLNRCVQKICEIQKDLESDTDDDDDDDAEAAGYATCVMETLKFLAQEGLPPDHPIVKGLSRKLLRQSKN